MDCIWNAAIDRFGGNEQGGMRPVCTSCNRPLRVCLCAHLPAAPLLAATQVLVLQHPHETRQKLATVPILAKCLSRCDVIVGRRLELGSSRVLDALAVRSSGGALGRVSDSEAEEERLGQDGEEAWRCASCRRAKRVLLLFPTAFASELTSWMSQRRFGTKDKGVEWCDGGDAGSHLILLVVDGTWQHAREMVKASMPFLEGFVDQVCLPHDVAGDGQGMGDSELIMRKEPFAGCVSTIEAVARALTVLESDGGEIERCLLSVLRQMVALQASHFQPLKPRSRLSRRRGSHDSEPTKEHGRASVLGVEHDLATTSIS